ncbi:DUF1800 domain-containing protein [Paracoccus beibuensis]|uniref:DUF1800 domain-containing protein n=1 Tax=Paracoccus beibuensis TaxID=547602 RepID=UPI0022402CCA|nr:DUF1800 domain-containing protein [Paracoccus beibuensis]
MSIPYDQLAAIRLGFGLSPRQPSPGDPAAVAASVARAAPDPDGITLDRMREWQRTGNRLARAARKGGAEAGRASREYRMRLGSRHRADILARFARAVDDPGGFGERLVWFWSDHFTVAGGTLYTNLMMAAFVQDAIRPHLAGRFADMMYAAETHPAMLRYLDQGRSVGPNSIVAQRNPKRAGGLNENLAREMIELHSLGVGAGYTQHDVEELAALLTGLTYHPKHPGVFQPKLAEPGPEEVLGQTYGSPQAVANFSDIRDVIDDLATHDATARHIARKMAVHFVADDPPQALVDRLAGVFTDAGGDLAAMNLALAEAPELESHFRQKLRQPFEFLVTSLRALGADGPQVSALKPGVLNQRLLRPMAVMGQPWGLPDGPDGWPEASEVWGAPQGIAMRINWALTHVAGLAGDLPDPRDFLAHALGGTASEAVAWAVPRAESRAEGIALVLASADFNRR